MKKSILFVALLFASLGTSGDCDMSNLPGACGSGQVASVVIDVRNEDGDKLDYAEIWFQVDDGGYYSGYCDGDCDDFAIAYNTVGDFDVAVRALGYLMQTKSVTVEIDEDGCWPVTQELTFELEEDNTVAVLSGAWRTTNAWGTSDIRFSDTGRVIGAILYDRVAQGDGNIYIAYNGYQIVGAAGQGITTATAIDPTRTGDSFTFTTTTLSFPIGFENAAMTTNLAQMFGTLQGTNVTYTRLSAIPSALELR